MDVFSIDKSDIKNMHKNVLPFISVQNSVEQVLIILYKKSKTLSALIENHNFHSHKFVKAELS